MPTREEVKAFVVQYLAALAAGDRIAQLDDLVTRFAGPLGQPPDEAYQGIMLEAMQEAMLAGVVVFARDLDQDYPWLWIIPQLASGHLTPRLFGQILGRVERLAWNPPPIVSLRPPRQALAYRSP